MTISSFDLFDLFLKWCLWFLGTATSILYEFSYLGMWDWEENSVLTLLIWTRFNCCFFLSYVKHLISHLTMWFLPFCKTVLTSAKGWERKNVRWADWKVLMECEVLLDLRFKPSYQTYVCTFYSNLHFTVFITGKKKFYIKYVILSLSVTLEKK